MITIASGRRCILLGVVFCFSLSGMVHAQTATPPANASGKEYVLTRKSSFDALAGAPRNPFWPIGWVPSANVTRVEAMVIDVQASAFRLTTTSVDYPPLAVINGRTYGVGEQVPVASHPGAFVTVRQILDGVAVLDYQGHELRVSSALPGRSGH